MNFRTIAITLICAATLGLTACDSDDLVQANAKIEKLEAQASNQASVNAALAKDKTKTANELLAEKARTAELEQRLALANTTVHKERVAKNHLIDQVKGAKQVAGTAVDHAHAKGVKDAVLADKQKAANKKS